MGMIMNSFTGGRLFPRLHSSVAFGMVGLEWGVCTYLLLRAKFCDSSIEHVQVVEEVDG